MREITGYYDGNTVQLLESAPKTKQKYADPEKRLLEEGAFVRAMVEKHGNG